MGRDTNGHGAPVSSATDTGPVHVPGSSRGASGLSGVAHSVTAANIDRALAVSTDIGYDVGYDGDLSPATRAAALGGTHHRQSLHCTDEDAEPAEGRPPREPRAESWPYQRALFMQKQKKWGGIRRIH